MENVKCQKINKKSNSVSRYSVEITPKSLPTDSVGLKNHRQNLSEACSAIAKRPGAVDEQGAAPLKDKERRVGGARAKLPIISGEISLI